jgi:two-component system sensor histidine kinase HydH
MTKFKEIGWSKIAFVLAGILLVSTGHYLTPPSLLFWHNVFQRLYYLPIVYAAVSFGLTGGLIAGSGVGICYIPHIVMTWHGNPHYSANQYAEIVVFFLVGAVTGVLADREQKQRQELQETAEQLRKVYQELQDSFEQLRRADRLSAIGQLSASLAHEIRNPLGSIEGAVDILERSRGADEKNREFLSIIKKECQRLGRLLTNLLDFAKPRQPRIEPVDIRQVVDAVVNLTSHAAERGAIALEIDLAPDLGRIEGDSEQLQQVLLNLTLNAMQAMPEGGTIRLVARQRNSEIVIEIADQGHGIDETDVETIFDPFYTTKRAGTGLGLSVAHQIVSQHAGRIRVRRNPDKGMNFTVILPVHLPRP